VPTQQYSTLGLWGKTGNQPERAWALTAATIHGVPEISVLICEKRLNISVTIVSWVLKVLNFTQSWIMSDSTFNHQSTSPKIDLLGSTWKTIDIIEMMILFHKPGYLHCRMDATSRKPSMSPKD
jgi:hypothetical protein